MENIWNISIKKDSWIEIVNEFVKMVDKIDTSELIKKDFGPDTNWFIFKKFEDVKKVLRPKTEKEMEEFLGCYMIEKDCELIFKRFITQEKEETPNQNFKEPIYPPVKIGLHDKDGNLIVKENENLK